MTQPIITSRFTIEEMEKENKSALAALLREHNKKAIVYGSAPVSGAHFMAYELQDGNLLFVTGSLSLFNRYERQVSI